MYPSVNIVHVPAVTDSKGNVLCATTTTDYSAGCGAQASAVNPYLEGYWDGIRVTAAPTKTMPSPASLPTWNNASVRGDATYTITPLTLPTPFLLFTSFATPPDRLLPLADLSLIPTEIVGSTNPQPTRSSPTNLDGLMQSPAKGSFQVTAPGGPIQATGSLQPSDSGGPIQATGSFQPRKRSNPEATLTLAYNDAQLARQVFGDIPQNLIDFLDADASYSALYPHLGSCLPGGPPVRMYGCPTILDSPIAAAAASDLIGSSSVSVNSAGCFHQGACAAVAAQTSSANPAVFAASVSSTAPISSTAASLTQNPNAAFNFAPDAAAQADIAAGTPSSLVDNPTSSSQDIGAIVNRPFGGLSITQSASTSPPIPPPSFTSGQNGGQMPQLSLINKPSSASPGDSLSIPVNAQNQAVSDVDPAPGSSVGNNRNGQSSLTAPPDMSPLPSLSISLGSLASNVVVNGVTSNLQGIALSALPYATSAPINSPLIISSTPGHDQAPAVDSALPTIVIGSQTYTANTASFYIIGSQTLAPGSSGIVVADSVVYNPSTSLPLLSAVTPITIGGQTATPNPTGFSIDGTFVSAGEPQVTIAGTPVSLGVSGILDVGNSTVTLGTNNRYAATSNSAMFTGKGSSDHHTCRLAWSVTMAIVISINLL